MKREIEKKFDVPLDWNDEGFLYALQDCSVAAGYEIDKPEILNRRFTYYDTSSLDLHKMNGTFRLVEGFDSLKYAGSHRYDLKVGPLEERFEESIWGNEFLDINGIFRKEIEKIGLLGQFSEKAMADMRNYKGDIRRGSLVVEYTLDYVAVRGARHPFKEFELKEGEKRDLNELSDIVQTSFNLNSLIQQKYSRILRMLGKI